MFDLVLYKCLQAHVQGQPLQLTPDEATQAGGVQVLMPLAMPPSSEKEGFVIHHSFRIQGNSEHRDCCSVKMIESPEVLAVHQLFSEDELLILRQAVCDLSYRPAVSSKMKVRVEGSSELQTFVVPNDLEELTISPAATFPERNCEVAVIDRHMDIFAALQMRAAAVCQISPEAIRTIVVERYRAAAHCFKNGHFSHQRNGAVLMPLEDYNGDGGICFNSIGIQLSPLAGMGLFLPSVYPGDSVPVPDLRTDFSIEFVQNKKNDPTLIHYVVAYVEQDLPSANEVES